MAGLDPEVVAAFVKRNLAHFPPMTEEQVAHVLVLMREGDREKARGVAGDDAPNPATPRHDDAR